MIRWPVSQEQQAKLIEWAAKRIKANSLMYPVAAAVYGDASGELLAVAIYHEYRKTDIQFSFAADSPHWATRHNIIDLLSYPFRQLGVQRITAMTDKTNRRARRLLEFSQFRLEGVLRDATADGPLCLYGMTRSDFAALSRQHGQARRTNDATG